jgi:hypothetical protein
VGQPDPRASQVDISFEPLSAYANSGAATEIQFIQRVKTEWWDSSNWHNHSFTDWHPDDAKSDTKPFYGYTENSTSNFTPWVLPFKIASMTDSPGLEADVVNPAIVVQVFETAAVVSKGADKGKLLGSIWWGQILWAGLGGASSSLRWVSGSGEMNIAGNTRGALAQGLWSVTGIGSYTQVAGAGDPSVTLKKIIPGEPSSKMWSLADSI